MHKIAYTFLLLSFLVNGLCNSIPSTSFKFDLFLLVFPDTIFLSKNLYIILVNPIWYSSSLGPIAIS